MLKKKLLLLIATFSFGAALMYAYKDHELNNNKKLTFALINACMQAEGINKDIQVNYEDSIKEVISCMADTKCDKLASIYRFGKISMNIDKLLKQKEKLSNDLLNAVHNYK